MKRLKSPLFIVFLLCLPWVISCEEEEEDTCFYCVYEKRSTSCSGYGFGAWEARESLIDSELKEGLTPTAFCDQAYPSSDIECAAGCCITFQFRDVSVQPCN